MLGWLVIDSPSYVQIMLTSSQLMTVNSETFGRVLNCAEEEFRENKPSHLAKWQNTLSFSDIDKLCQSPKLLTLKNISFNDIRKI